MTMRHVVLLLAVFLLGGCGYNSIQSKDEAVTAGWSEVVNQYQRRADLVPNLVNTVKGYAEHEEEVLTKVTEARASVGKIQISAADLTDEAKLKQFQAAQGELSSALSRLMACFRTCRRSWRAPKTASPSRAIATSLRCRNTTRSCAASRRT
jgi:LemA protein